MGYYYSTLKHSFEIVPGDWGVSGKPLHFAYSTTNTYNLSRDYPPTEDDTISIHINPATDSIEIYKFFGTRGTSAYYRQTDKFSGKLQ